MPYDPVSVLVAAIAGTLILASMRCRAVATRMALILLAAFLIRMDAASTRSLHPWDERFHVLVAKNLLDHPLTPMLYRAPAIDYDSRDWTAKHIWLHKPPGALWLMAGSMRIFGVNEIAARLPSVLLASAAVVLTFLIGRVLFTPAVGLLAAGFHAVNGFLVALVAGRRVADHVDTALIVFVELGVWAALQHARRQRTGFLVLAGAALGAAFLTKSLPALIILPVAFAVFLQYGSTAAAFRKCAILTLLGAIVAAPWMLYIWNVFPQEAAAAELYTLQHVWQSLEGHDRNPFGYLTEMPRFFGELVWIPLTAVTVAAVRGSAPALVNLVVWVAVPYITFSMMTTRLPGYVMTAAPALFLIQAYFWCGLREQRRAMPRGWQRAAATVLLVLLAVLPARHVLEPTGSLERRDRNPATSQELRTLEARLQLPDAVIFNIPMPIEAMFYSPYTAYSQMPTADQVRTITAGGRPVVIYQPAGAHVEVPPNWRVVLLTGNIRELPVVTPPD